jgi:hypothetical protein
MVKVHPRQPPGGRHTDPADFPAHKTVYALRDVAALARMAAAHGPTIGAYAHALLAVPLPWTRMRRVYALLGLVKRYGATRVDAMCTVALDADLVDVTRLKRMLALATPPPVHAPRPAVPALHWRRSAMTPDTVTQSPHAHALPARPAADTLPDAWSSPAADAAPGFPPALPRQPRRDSLAVGRRPRRTSIRP